MKTLALGDLTVIGGLPPKLLKACAAIGAELHDAFDRQVWIAPGKSRESCILATLAVRDFLRAIGFPDAEARPVMAMMAAYRHGDLLHSLGIGAPDTPPKELAWNGHLVVTLRSARALIDTTLYPSKRDAWPMLPGMLALRLPRHVKKIEQYGLTGLAGYDWHDPDDGYEFRIIWLDNPKKTDWRTAPDVEPWRRQAVTAALVERFGIWEE